MDLQKNIVLANFTTLRVGGSADYFVHAKSAEDLIKAYDFAREHNLPFFLLGGGSNTFFHEAGFRGVVIRNEYEGLDFSDNKITAASGSLLANVVGLALRHQLSGLENLVGIPGTIGGAIAGNAGVPKQSIGEILLEAEIYNGKERRIVKPDFFKFSYRTSSLKEKKSIILLKVILKLKAGERNNLRISAQEILAERLAKQPYKFPSAGSFFKNPIGEKSAGWYLDQAGCKGWTEGGAKISEKHANFIINFQNATSFDIINLAYRARKAVEEKFGIKLEQEVVMIGEGNE